MVVPDPGSLTLASARVVFPIAHKYAMHGLLCECVATVRRDLLIWPADGLTDLSTLLGWLSLGSSLHDQTLVNVCLDKLFVAMPVARHAFCEALYSREIREVLHDLDPETMLSLLSLLGGLSSPAQVGLRVFATEVLHPMIHLSGADGSEIVAYNGSISTLDDML